MTVFDPGVAMWKTQSQPRRAEASGTTRVGSVSS